MTIPTKSIQAKEENNYFLIRYTATTLSHAMLTQTCLTLSFQLLGRLACVRIKELDPILVKGRLILVRLSKLGLKYFL